MDPIWTKNGMDMLCQVQNLQALLSSVKGTKSTKFDPTKDISARHLNPFFRLVQNFTWTYSLMLLIVETSLWINFSFSSKCKMASRCQKLNFNTFLLKNDISALQTDPVHFGCTKFSKKQVCGRICDLL